ncbi:MAG TPA: N-acetyltransferase [Methanosarcinales archaeon]|nr:N-acetyltransferase [Methanosarcinales archaeon]
MIHKSARLYGKNKIGKNCIIMEDVIIGYPIGSLLNQSESKEMDYIGASLGDNLRTGHNILIRENTKIGNNVLIGTNVVIEGYTNIGNKVSIQSNVFIPINTIIEDNVFVGPCAVLTNDKYPIRIKKELKGPRLGKGASIGANSTILPNVVIGEGAIVAAGAVVTKDVPPWKLALGVPAKIKEIPKELKVENKI